LIIALTTQCQLLSLLDAARQFYDADFGR